MNPGEERRIIPYKGQTASIQYSVRVRCDRYYYGNKCNKQCRPRDDYFGHYTCDHFGNMQCMEGWTGSDCKKGVQVQVILVHNAYREKERWRQLLWHVQQCNRVLFKSQQNQNWLFILLNIAVFIIKDFSLHITVYFVFMYPHILNLMIFPSPSQWHLFSMWRHNNYLVEVTPISKWQWSDNHQNLFFFLSFFTWVYIMSENRRSQHYFIPTLTIYCWH